MHTSLLLGVSWLLMWSSERRRLRPLVLKVRTVAHIALPLPVLLLHTSFAAQALFAHGHRNRKTALMFTTALAFILFMGTSFALQGSAVVAGWRLLFGTATHQSNRTNYVNMKISHKFTVSLLDHTIAFTQEHTITIAFTHEHTNTVVATRPHDSFH